MFRLLFKYFYCMAWDPYRGPGGKAFSGALEWFSNGSRKEGLCYSYMVSHSFHPLLFQKHLQSPNYSHLYFPTTPTPLPPLFQCLYPSCHRASRRLSRSHRINGKSLNLWQLQWSSSGGCQLPRHKKIEPDSYHGDSHLPRSFFQFFCPLSRTLICIPTMFLSPSLTLDTPSRPSLLFLAPQLTECEHIFIEYFETRKHVSNLLKITDTIHYKM